MLWRFIFGTNVDREDPMRNFSKIAGSVVGTTTLAALPHAAGAGPISESEPNNPFINAQSVNVGDTLNGSNNGGSDPIDFFKYTGLPIGGNFDFLVSRDHCCADGFQIEAQLYTSDTTTTGPAIDLDIDDIKHLQGLVPGSGQLTLGVKLTGSRPFSEGYHVTLSVTPPSRVPQPATIALLLAGLAGLQVLRRRKPR